MILMTCNDKTHSTEYEERYGKAPGGLRFHSRWYDAQNRQDGGRGRVTASIAPKYTKNGPGLSAGALMMTADTTN